MRPACLATPPRTVTALALIVGFSLAPTPAPAQSNAHDPGTPEAVADEFNRGFQSMAWAGLVQRIHPHGLADLRLAADILVRADTSGYVLERLLGDVAPGRYPELTDDDVVGRLLAGIQSEVPGLLSSLVSRRTTVLGSVPEGDRRHVVYRIQAQVSGSVPETRVMTLERFENRWRVVEAEDLRVLHTAIRGIPIPRRESASRDSAPTRPGGEGAPRRASGSAALGPDPPHAWADIASQ
jgi:hypothetical protein